MDITQLIQTAQFVIKSLKEDDFSKIVNAEITAAAIDSATLTKESNVRDGLNRILTHLETAYVLYTKCINGIHIRNWVDYENNMYKKAGKLNKICEGIALVHYKLGNIEVAQTWLLKMLSDGEYHYSQYLYERILRDRYSDFKMNVLDVSDNHKRSIDTRKEMVIDEGCGFNPNML